MFNAARAPYPSLRRPLPLPPTRPVLSEPEPAHAGRQPSPCMVEARGGHRASHESPVESDLGSQSPRRAGPQGCDPRRGLRARQAAPSSRSAIRGGGARSAPNLRVALTRPGQPTLRGFAAPSQGAREARGPREARLRLAHAHVSRRGQRWASPDRPLGGLDAVRDKAARPRRPEPGRGARAHAHAHGVGAEPACLTCFKPPARRRGKKNKTKTQSLRQHRRFRLQAQAQSRGGGAGRRPRAHALGSLTARRAS